MKNREPYLINSPTLKSFLNWEKVGIGPHEVELAALEQFGVEKVHSG